MKRFSHDMRVLRDKLLSLLYPERCVLCDKVIAEKENGLCKDCREKIRINNEPICKKCGRKLLDETEEYCQDCKKYEHNFCKGLSFCLYDAEVKNSMYRLKYGNRRRYAYHYGKMMAEHFSKEIESWNADAIIPVPLHKKRFRKRGYNQAELIAQSISMHTGIKVASDIIFREKTTEAMKYLNRAERQNNLKKAFKVGRNNVKLKTVIVVDDIFTTGTTIDEMSYVLKNTGVKRVYFLVIASGCSM